MKKYRVRFNENREMCVFVTADSPEEAKEIVMNYSNLQVEEYISRERYFNEAIEIDEYDEDIEGTEWYG